MKLRINIEVLRQMVLNGNTRYELADHFKVHMTAIDYHVRKLGLKVNIDPRLYNKGHVNFDQEKVNRVKAQIANGTYVIDAAIIADEIIGMLK